MKKRINHPYALTASAILALLSFQNNAMSQSVLELTGSLSGPTCVLMGAQGSGGTATAATNQKLDLGTGTLGDAITSSGVGSDLGANWQEKKMTFSLSQDGTAGVGSCSFGVSGANGWDIVLSPKEPNLILDNNGSKFLQNSAPLTKGGTDAVVLLKGGLGTTPSNTLDLSDTGVYLSSGTQTGLFTAGSASSISMSARLVHGKASGSKPVAGVYSTFINLMVKYQ